MDNGCPKCEILAENELCLTCQLGMAEWHAMRSLDEVEELRKKIAKEKEDVSADTSDIG